MASPASLVLEILAAFLAGLILNFMPCVLPVIALKALGFIKQSKQSPARVRLLGWAYGAGVLASFVLLAGLAIATQRAGGEAGWGDALRHPQFRMALTALITLIALNLFGLFEVTIHAGVMGPASELASQSGMGGAFCNGILATVLATPCTAPFLAGALAFALTQRPAVTLLVFLAVGAGLACPFVLVCSFPRLLKFLPKPGPWMEKFKIAMGFPMLATALWLAYGSTRSQADMLMFEFSLALLALAAWVWGQFVQRETRRKGLAVAVCLLLVAAGFYFRQVPAMKTGALDWKVWSPQAVDMARREGHPVLVDFTAKTCLNCIVNKASSLETKQTRAKLSEIGAVTFEADFTDQDPVIAQELERWKGAHRCAAGAGLFQGPEPVAPDPPADSHAFHRPRRPRPGREVVKYNVAPRFQLNYPNPKPQPPPRCQTKLTRPSWASSWAASRIGKPCATPPSNSTNCASLTRPRSSPPIAPRTSFLNTPPARPRGLEVIIAAAGGAAHLAGVTAAKTCLPVLGVPMESKSLHGMDSLLSMVQMPGGVPVGTLAIGKPGAINAALLAVAILGNKHPHHRAAYEEFRRQQTARCLADRYPKPPA